MVEVEELNGVSGCTALQPEKRGKGIRLYFQKKKYQLDLMILPGILFLIVFNIIPLYGIYMCFIDYVPAKGISAANGSDCKIYLICLLCRKFG